MRSMNCFLGLVINGKWMGKRFSVIFLFTALLFNTSSRAQTAEEIIRQVREKIARVNDYEAKGKLKTNVAFIKAPIANVKIYFKKPDKLRIQNTSGISFIPKGSVNISLNNVFTDIS